MVAHSLGLRKDPFISSLKLFGVWPNTVLELDYADELTRKLRHLVGDMGEGREDCFQSTKGKESRVYKTTVSIFNPVLAMFIFNMWAPEKGVCYDPFAGGGTRAIVAAKYGMKYVGVEIRKKEVDEIYRRCEMVDAKVRIIHGDSQRVPQVMSGSADFLITCPPYYDLEKYNGGKDDLSMAPTYERFLEMTENCIKESHRILKPGSLSCWVTGLQRDRDKNLLFLNHDISRIHLQNGFRAKEEVIVFLKNTSSQLRAGTFRKGNHLLIRVHQYLNIFEKA
jgi:DNA modification methylase